MSTETTNTSSVIENENAILDELSNFEIIMPGQFALECKNPLSQRLIDEITKSNDGITSIADDNTISKDINNLEDIGDLDFIDELESSKKNKKRKRENDTEDDKKSNKKVKNSKKKEHQFQIFDHELGKKRENFRKLKLKKGYTYPSKSKKKKTH